MSETLVTTEINDKVAVVTLNRPEALNALSKALCDQLEVAFKTLGENESVQAIVLTGAGKAFTVGLDLKELATGSDILADDALGPEARVINAISKCGKPVVGAINGFAVTGGFELALACDFLYAAESAKFADTHARVGIIPGWGLSQKLPRLVGVNRAREISFTGNYFSAADGERWGLVNKVVADDELLDAAMSCARDIAETIPHALYQVRSMINDGWELTLQEGLELEGRAAKAMNSSMETGHLEQRLGELQQRGRKQ
jgi:enoyl-CoA hydratase